MVLLRFGDELYIRYWLVNLTIFLNETSTFYGYIRLIEERYHIVVQINEGKFFITPLVIKILRAHKKASGIFHWLLEH